MGCAEWNPFSLVFSFLSLLNNLVNGGLFLFHGICIKDHFLSRFFGFCPIQRDTHTAAYMNCQSTLVIKKALKAAFELLLKVYILENFICGAKFNLRFEFCAIYCTGK